MPNSRKALEEAASCLRKSLTWYKDNRVYERYHLSPIWTANIELHFLHVFSMLEEENVTAADVIAYLNDRAFFDNCVPYPQLPHALDWYEKLLSKNDAVMSLLPPEAGESPLFANKRCETRNGRKISSDFYVRLCVITRLRQSVPVPGRRETVVELGSGSGNLARMFKLLYPDTTYVCVDIPESLFFAQLNLLVSFPDAKILYVSNDKKIPDIEKYDFIFIPSEFAASIQGLDTDIFFNTLSLGEMKDEVIAHWFRFIQSTIKTRHVFLLNRFLNRVDTEAMSHRFHEASCSLSMDRYWDILDWEIDPEFERCPYCTTLVTRNLLVIGRRNLSTEAIGEYEKTVLNRVPAIQLEDWSCVPYWDNYKYCLGDSLRYPPLNSRADLNFTHDLTKTGSLFTVWEYFRLTRAVGAAQLLLQWMTSAGGVVTPFEEALYLQSFDEVESGYRKTGT